MVEIRVKYFYSCVALKYSFDILVFYLSTSIFCYFILLFDYISERNIVLYTPLHIFYSYNYYTLSKYNEILKILKCDTLLKIKTKLTKLNW